MTDNVHGLREGCRMSNGASPKLSRAPTNAPVIPTLIRLYPGAALKSIGNAFSNPQIELWHGAIYSKPTRKRSESSVDSAVAHRAAG